MSKIIWYETKMTSNTAPTPLVASASATHSTSSQYRAFDGLLGGSGQSWITPDNSGANQWIQIYFGELKKVNLIKINARNDGFFYQNPYKFKIQHSMDGTNFIDSEIIESHKFTSQSDSFEFKLKEIIEASYFRLYVTELFSGNNNISIGEITYGYENSNKLIVNNTTTNKSYSLDSKTLIHLPSSSNKNMILHGIEAGKEIKLDEPFDKIRTVIDNEDGTQTVTDEIITPFSVYDYISETPEVLVYTELTDDVTIETSTEPFDIYDEFGQEIDVLYYTDDTSVTEADLILEANWSPVDELDGDLEVVTWTDETGDSVKRNLELTAIPKPQFVHQTTINNVHKLDDVIATDLSKFKTLTSIVKVLFTPNNTDWYYFNGTTFVKLTSFTMDNVVKYGNTIAEINAFSTLQFNTWSFDRLNVGFYLEDDNKDRIESKVSNINIVNFTPDNSTVITDTSFYILNTTARIDIDLQGMSVFGTLSDADMSRVQYRVKLNGQPYFPIDGEFTALAPSPQSISLNFTSDQIIIDDWNTVEVEFQDFFGTTDTWSTQFVGRYAGIMFTDENGELYSTDVGQVLKYLDFGTVLTGQVTPTYTVKLKNQYGFNVKEVNIQAHTSGFAEGLNLDFSLENDVNTFSDTLLIPSMKNEEEISFYLRMRSPITTEPNGHNLFDIFVSAKRDV